MGIKPSIVRLERRTPQATAPVWEPIALQGQIKSESIQTTLCTSCLRPAVIRPFVKTSQWDNKSRGTLELMASVSQSQCSFWSMSQSDGQWTNPPPIPLTCQAAGSGLWWILCIRDYSICSRRVGGGSNQVFKHCKRFGLIITIILQGNSPENYQEPFLLLNLIIVVNKWQREHRGI